MFKASAAIAVRQAEGTPRGREAAARRLENDKYIICSKCKSKYMNDEEHMSKDFGYTRLEERYKAARAEPAGVGDKDCPPEGVRRRPRRQTGPDQNRPD